MLLVVFGCDYEQKDSLLFVNFSLYKYFSTAHLSAKKDWVFGEPEKISKHESQVSALFYILAFVSARPSFPI
jgi:hypothetical protein